MPTPKSPVEKSSSSHSRRPSLPRRSSSDKSLKSSKHGSKIGTSSHSKSKDSMSDVNAGAKAPKSEKSRAEGGSTNTATDPKQLDRSDSSAREAQDIHGGIEGFKKETSDIVGTDNSAEAVERLKAAMNAQLKLNQQREKLARDMNAKEEEGQSNTAASFPERKTRISPIHEENTTIISPPSFEGSFMTPPSALDTTSTESARTIRGGMTPAAAYPRTPSYPFPSMRVPATRQVSWGAHRPFTALSPTVNPSNYAGGTFDTGHHDQVLSGSVTPSSTLHFHPPGGQTASQDDPNYETPNLYELSLMLAAEPGLDAWWTTVAQIMRDIFKADRVTLSLPADSTDIENVPWGQKATFNAAEEDELSLAYLQRGSSLVPSSSDTNNTSNSEDTNHENLQSLNLPVRGAVRPGMVSRHSFTTYEDTKRDTVHTPEPSRAHLSRPVAMARAQSYLSPRSDPTARATATSNTELSLEALQEHLTIEDTKPQPAGWEENEMTSRETWGRVFSVLQALDFEADPLLDSGGVLRVLERGRVVALTRDYPYLERRNEDPSTGSSKSSSGTKKESQEKNKKGKSPEITSRISSFLGNTKRPSKGARSLPSEKGRILPGSSLSRTDEDDLRPPSPRYEEYEQAPASPWAQSPAPSPAVRSETAENPFFAGLAVDEESFNPSAPSPQDYSQSQPVEAIGIDRSWTVLHIPLIHPLLSKPVQSFRLDAAAIELKNASRAKAGTTSENQPNLNKTPMHEPSPTAKATPIAILSVLTPVIPYPSNLRHSLANLAAHLATSFSLCRHYTNLETELAGLTRKRPSTVGFGAVATGNRPGDRNFVGNVTYSPVDESGPQRSGGSITSPSDYSGVSRSTTGSPPRTPNWDPSRIGFSRDKRSSGGSPGHSFSAEGYFNAKARPPMTRHDTGSASSVAGARNVSRETSYSEVRVNVQSREEERTPASHEKSESEDATNTSIEPSLSRSSTMTPKQEPPLDRRPRDTTGSASEVREGSPVRKGQDPLFPRRQAIVKTSAQGSAKAEKHHTQLHSYGADYGATFQSLPTTTTPTTKTFPEAKVQSRSGSISEDAPQHMLPPSDRLKGLMLDSLPAHVFVALPVTGEIVWVNNRYLNYRGQTVPDLYANPWGTIHPEEREEYLRAWSHAVRSGEQFSKQVRIRRFDGNYRWFYTRAVGHRDIRGVIVQWYGSHMDIHDQHIAEVRAARQEEIEASEAKHRQLANLIPQIIFAATEDEGVTFANEQWLSYTGQAFEDALGLGFMDFVHPEDLAKCTVPSVATASSSKKPAKPSRNPSHSSSQDSSNKSSNVSDTPTESTAKGVHATLSRNNSSSNGSFTDFPMADLTELARNGVIKASTDANGRLSYTTEVRLRSKSGEYRWHLVRCVEVDNISLGSGDGSWFGACTDINEHKLLETKLKEAMDSKTRFLSNMSHEIRTPLIGISGMVNFLQDTPLNDEQIDYANTINASANSLLNIINDILDLSKVDAGMMKLSYNWFHPRSLVEEVNEMVCTMAITKRLELNYIVDNDVPEMVKGDHFRIRQVLLNIVGNAIKFTTVGEVFSSCKVVLNAPDLGENEVMLEFSVIDTGRGFTKGEAEMIFKPFSQIDGSSTRQHGGSGLGLVISRTLVELHGGKMEGSAVPGKGSTFVFTAKFSLPTAADHPDPPSTPLPKPLPITRSSSTIDEPVRTAKQSTGINKFIQTPVDSPKGDLAPTSPAVLSSGSSTPSVRSIHSHVTQRSSGSSIAQSLSHFGEAARSGSQDISKKLSLPEKKTSMPLSPPASTPTRSLSLQDDLSIRKLSDSSEPSSFRPPMYSILLICPQTHSREATTQHIENTLPKFVPHQITALASVAESEDLIAGEDPVHFTHIVLNLGSAEEIVSVIERIKATRTYPLPSIVILSDPVERQEVMKLGIDYDYEQLTKDNLVTFIYKPVKPSRFSVVFDPDKERELSMDRNRFSAQMQVASQKQNYLDVAKRLGNKGYKVLLVEDNLVNQKVLLKYLGKIGIAVELALDGVECVEKVFAKPHSFYSLILCDLHMPRKDGYQTCREIRQWEKKGGHTAMPIIALSANVMADVLDKCVQAGFSNYVTKPVDFKALSAAMGDLLEPINSGAKASMMK